MKIMVPTLAFAIANAGTIIKPSAIPHIAFPNIVIPHPQRH
jgi:hypothetical protein